MIAPRQSKKTPLPLVYFFPLIEIGFDVFCTLYYTESTLSIILTKGLKLKYFVLPTLTTCIMVTILNTYTLNELISQ